MTLKKKEFTPLLCFLHAEPPPPPHRSPEQNKEKKKEFSPCHLLPPLGLCRPLLAQTSTTPHTGAHRHRVRRSCAWSLETNRSRREPRSKGLFFMIFPFTQFGFRIIDGFFCFLGLWVQYSCVWDFGFWNWSLWVLGIASFVLILLVFWFYGFIKPVDV